MRKPGRFRFDSRLFVVCKHCRQDFHTDSVEFLNIEEDIQGRDLMTFKCPTCHREEKSLVIRRG